MPRLVLSICLSANERTRPIVDGSLQADGIDLVPTLGHPSEIFWRQLRFAEFDVSEMSLSSLMVLASRGASPWLALPIFTTRRFFHVGVLVRKDVGIDQPTDLRGKRIGVPEYQQTAALWTRGALQHEFNVAPQDMIWYMERGPERSHGAATHFKTPPGIRLEYVAPTSSLAEMLIAGDLDALAVYVPDRNLVDRGGGDVKSHPGVRSLFADPLAEATRYYRKTGIWPINHCLVVRRTLVESHAWVAVNLFKAFTTAKELVQDRCREVVEAYVQLGELPSDARRVFTTDPFPYGVRSNRQVLETLTLYSREQGLTARRVSLDEIFAPSTMDL